MKKISSSALILIGMFAATSLFAQGKLEVTVKNIKELKGTVMVALFNNEKDFPNKFLQGKMIKATANEVTVVFDKLTIGDYAVSVYHDVNDNTKLDANFMGIPNEPYGFSNNVMGSFGPPSFEKAKVNFDSDKVIEINLR